MWLKAIGAPKLPTKVDESATAKQIIQAFQESHDALADSPYEIAGDRPSEGLQTRRRIFLRLPDLP